MRPGSITTVTIVLPDIKNRRELVIVGGGKNIHPAEDNQQQV